MVEIFHVVGAADIGLHLDQLPTVGTLPAHKIREKAVNERLRLFHKLPEKLASSSVDELEPEDFDLLFKSQSKSIGWNPLAALFDSLQPSDDAATPRPVRLHLLSTEQKQNKLIALLLEQILSSPVLKKTLHGKWSLELTVDREIFSNFEETKVFKKLAHFAAPVGDSTEPVLIPMMSGATKLVLSLMGAMDQVGRPWRLLYIDPSSERHTVATRASNPDASFYWLRALGFLTEAKNEALRLATANLIDPSLEQLVQAVEKLDCPTQLTADDKALLACIEITRSDYGAAMGLRAWVEAEYRRQLAEENEGRDASSAFDDVFAKEKGQGSAKLGTAICNAKKHVSKADAAGQDCSKAAEWLSQQSALNEIGNEATHRGELPTLDELKHFKQTDPFCDLIPAWMPWPGSGPILYIAPSGLAIHLDDEEDSSDGSINSTSPVERILEGEQPTAIRRSLPGGPLLDRSTVPVEFMFLQSDDPSSRELAQSWIDKTMCASTWASVGTKCAQALEIPEDFHTKPWLAAQLNKRKIVPGAVVLLTTGQKNVLLSCLDELSQWCSKRAIPLFVQSYWKESGQVTPQYHRIATDPSARLVLLDAALTSLRSLNLSTTVRALSAGDHELRQLATECADLADDFHSLMRVDHLDQNDDGKENARRIIEVLEYIASLLADETKPVVQNRLLVIAAEISKFDGKQGIDAFMQRGRGNDAPSRELHELNTGNLLGALNRARNMLPVTHGAKTVDQAIRAALEYGNVSIPDGSTAAQLLERLCILLRKALGVPPASDAASNPYCTLLSKVEKLRDAGASSPIPSTM